MVRQSFYVADNRIIVTLAGKMHLDEALIFKERLLEFLEQGYIDFLVDMRRLKYIECTGLGVLVAVHRRAARSGGRVVLRDTSGAVREILEMTKLTKLFPNIESVPKNADDG